MSDGAWYGVSHQILHGSQCEEDAGLAEGECEERAGEEDVLRWITAQLVPRLTFEITRDVFALSGVPCDSAESSAREDAGVSWCRWQSQRLLW